MKQQDKLKLLRGLYFLSQEEMARIAGCQRSFYAATESNKPLPLLEKQAAKLEKRLGFDAVWFADQADQQPLISNRILIISMDWASRLLGVTANVRSSRINIAEKAVADNLPQLLNDTKLVACVRGIAPEGGQITLFVFNKDAPQGLFLCTIAGQKISGIVDEVARQQEGVKTIELTDNEFNDISLHNPSSVRQFIERGKLPSYVVEEFSSIYKYIGEYCFNYDELFGDNARQIALQRILQDIKVHKISLNDISAAYSQTQLLSIERYMQEKPHPKNG